MLKCCSECNWRSGCSEPCRKAQDEQFPPEKEKNNKSLLVSKEDVCSAKNS